MDHGSVRPHGRLQVDHRRKRLVCHLDEIGRVPGGSQVGGNDHGDRVTDVAHHAVDHQRVAFGHLHVSDPRTDRQRPAARGDVFPGPDYSNTGRPARRLRVNGRHLRMGMRAADEDHVQQAGQHNVVDVRCGAGDEPGILPTLDAGAERTGNRHRSPRRNENCGTRD